MSAIQVPPPEVDVIAEPKLKLDLACGQSCQDGFVGVDISPDVGAKYVHDLNVYPWPFETSSVDEVRSSHYLEHLDGEQQISFMNELWRILKPGAGAIIVTPYGFSVRAWQDPTHKRPIVAECYLYYNKGWRESQKLTHGPYARIVADFDTTFPWTNIDGSLVSRSAEHQNFAARFYTNAISDIAAQCVARK